MTLPDVRRSGDPQRETPTPNLEYQAQPGIWIGGGLTPPRFHHGVSSITVWWAELRQDWPDLGLPAPETRPCQARGLIEALIPNGR